MLVPGYVRNVNSEGERETTSRPWLPQSPMNTIELQYSGKMRGMSLVLGVLGVLAVIITLNRQQILILNTIDMMTTWLQTDYNSTLEI